MSHIIIEAKIEDVERALKHHALFKGRGELLLIVERKGFELPVIFVETEEGVVVKVANGGNHVDQSLIQCAIAEVVSFLGFSIIRSTLSKGVLKKYDLLDT